MTEFLKLAHLTRGSWFARATNSHTIRLIGTDPIPILPDREEGAFDWQAGPAPTFAGRAEEGGPDWWMTSEHAAWRAALIPEALVWVRQVMPDGTDDIAAGRSKGVWRIATAEVEPGRMFIELSDRIGEAR